jgi:ATP-dependent Clp protease, protease subunit
MTQLPAGSPTPENKKSENDVSTLFLTGEININLATEICRELMAIEAQNKEAGVFPPVQLIINSPGGDLFSTWMICDLMSMMETPIHTIGLGQVASGGFILFMHGTCRIATSNTQFMSHIFSMVNEGNYSNMKNQRLELDRTHQRIINHYSRSTGLSKDDVEKYLLTEHDVWLSAEECKQYNIADVVIDYDQLYKKSAPSKKKKNGRKKRK